MHFFSSSLNCLATLAAALVKMAPTLAGDDIGVGVGVGAGAGCKRKVVRIKFLKMYRRARRTTFRPLNQTCQGPRAEVADSECCCECCSDRSSDTDDDSCSEPEHDLHDLLSQHNVVTQDAMERSMKATFKKAFTEFGNTMKDFFQDELAEALQLQDQMNASDWAAAKDPKAYALRKLNHQVSMKENSLTMLQQQVREEADELQTLHHQCLHAQRILRMTRQFFLEMEHIDFESEPDRCQSGFPTPATPNNRECARGTRPDADPDFEGIPKPAHPLPPGSRVWQRPLQFLANKARDARELEETIASMNIPLERLEEPHDVGADLCMSDVGEEL